MPKIKSKSGVKKRFRLTSKKKIKRKKAFARHILSKKSSSRMRNLRKPGKSTNEDGRIIKKLLPYG